MSIKLDRVAVIVLGGGEGKRLAPLTESRCKPAISFGGRYTLIDVPISHSLSSGLTNIFVIGQYLASTLKEHLHQTYHKQIELLVPDEGVCFEGTADAVRKNLATFEALDADYFLILSGDQLYNIDFNKMLDIAHRTDAGMLIATQPVGKRDARRMGLLKIEHGGSKIVDFYEKPQEEVILQEYYTDTFTLNQLGYDSGKHYLGSMGIYLFKRDVMFNLLKEDKRDDFGKHLIRTQMQKGDVHAFLYDGYWEDIGTIESYYHANLALTRQEPDGFQCHDEGNHIISKRYHLPGVQIAGCRVDEALICEGSIVEGDEVVNSVLGIRSMVGQGSIVRDSILLGNQYYEHPKQEYRLGVGENCHIERAILDENVTLGDHVHLINAEGYENYEAPDGRVIVRDGIIVIPRGTHLPDHYTF